PRRFLPKYMPMARLDDAYKHQGSDGENWQTSLYDTITNGRDYMSHEQEVQKAMADAEAIRPKLTNTTDIAMLDSVIARVKNPGDTKGTLSESAKEIGITKGAASKVAARLRKVFGK